MKRSNGTDERTVLTEIQKNKQIRLKVLTSKYVQDNKFTLKQVYPGYKSMKFM